ncbi:MAG: hypothetical protein KDK24_04055 [Pseudooceanicola sp.]|nr:hypothetical protein [Pseudooceanicola sp.]
MAKQDRNKVMKMLAGLEKDLAKFDRAEPSQAKLGKSIQTADKLMKEFAGLKSTVKEIEKV